MGILRVILAIVATPVALALAAPVMIVGLPFWLVTVLARALARRIEPRFAPWDKLIEFDPVLGWKPRPNLDAHYFAAGDDVFHIRTDADGWPSRRSMAESDIVVIGDSFVFGYGVDTDSMFTEMDPELRVKAVGCPGYSMVQGVLLMRQLSAQLRGKLVVWFVCVENDLYDNVMPNKPNFYRTPFVRRVNGDDKWEIVSHHVTPSRWQYSADGRPYYPMLARLCTPGPLSQRVYAACKHLIEEARDICAQAGAELVVVTVPNKNQLSPEGLEFLLSHNVDRANFDPDYPDHRIGEMCRALGIRFVTAKKYLNAEDYKEHDTHWNAQGHRQMAVLLRDVSVKRLAQ